MKMETENYRGKSVRPMLESSVLGKIAAAGHDAAAAAPIFCVAAAWPCSRMLETVCRSRGDSVN